VMNDLAWIWGGPDETVWPVNAPVYEVATGDVAGCRLYYANARPTLETSSSQRGLSHLPCLLQRAYRRKEARGSTGWRAVEA